MVQSGNVRQTTPVSTSFDWYFPLGDVLLWVNGENVQEMSQEDVLQKLLKAPPLVKVVVGRKVVKKIPGSFVITMYSVHVKLV